MGAASSIDLRPEEIDELVTLSGCKYLYILYP